MNCPDCNFQKERAMLLLVSILVVVDELSGLLLASTHCLHLKTVSILVVVDELSGPRQKLKCKFQIKQVSILVVVDELSGQNTQIIIRTINGKSQSLL